MSITLSIVIITAVVSFTALSNQKIIDDLIFTPPAIAYRKQWYRFFTCALIHADIGHLLFNMYTLYIFGGMVEAQFQYVFGSRGPLLYLALYVVSQAICLIPTYLKHKNNYTYKSLGASGAVSAIVFAGIVVNPTLPLGIIFLPFRLPGYVFGLIYLVITAVLDRRGGGYINHSAHLWGALAGIVLLLIFGYLFSPYDLVQNFIWQVKGQ